MSQDLPLPLDLQANSLPLDSLADGNSTNDVIVWNGTEWKSSVSGGTNVLGTTNQITSTNNVVSLPNTIITPGSLTTTTSLTASTDLIVKGSSTLGSTVLPTSNNSFTSDTVFYSTGTVSQSGIIVTGVGTSFASNMLGLHLVYNNGVDGGIITAVNSTTSLTVSTNQNVGSQSYKIYKYGITTNLLTGNVGVNCFAPPNNFSVMPINTSLTFPGTVSQSGNTVTGSSTNFTSNMIGLYLIYTTGVYGGLITAVSSTTSLTVDTSQNVSSTQYIIQYAGYQVSNTGQSIMNGRAFTTETINTSTALSTYLDSLIDTSTGVLTCTLGRGIADQYKFVRLNTLRGNNAIVSCVLSGGGTFQLNPNNPIRKLRYNSSVGYWQMEGGISGNIPIPNSFYPTTQQGTKLIGTGNNQLSTSLGRSVAVSADGNTLATGGGIEGAMWVFTRIPGSTAWTQQGTQLIGTGATGVGQQGISVALSADGNTIAFGGYQDNSNQGATWIFTRSGTTWTQQGAKLVGTGNTGAAQQGTSCALSADGNTLAVGGSFDNSFAGATWIFTRSGTTWTQQGTKLVGTGGTGLATQGSACSLSADGNTLAVGGNFDNSNIGASWIFTRSGTTWTQQGTKLVGTGATGTSQQGGACALSADGSVLAVGGNQDNSNIGATWIFTRTNTTWSQQGTKLIGTGNTGSAQQGISCSLSADGNTLAVGGLVDNNNIGATWVFTRSGITWSQQGAKLVGTGNTGSSQQGISCALSANGNTLVVGGSGDNSTIGSTWIFT